MVASGVPQMNKQNAECPFYYLVRDQRAPGSHIYDSIAHMSSTVEGQPSHELANDSLELLGGASDDARSVWIVCGVA